jgi:hypothetical protein
VVIRQKCINRCHHFPSLNRERCKFRTFSAICHESVAWSIAILDDNRFHRRFCEFLFKASIGSINPLIWVPLRSHTC